jgi:undecaprenyl-diphosphatase
VATWLIGYLILAALLIGVGLVLTSHSLTQGAVGRWDEAVSRWFVVRRTADLNSITEAGSTLGSTPVVVGAFALAAIVLWVGGYSRGIVFLACALSLEFAVFLTTAFVVGRARPAVPRLDPAPVTSSYPSGHAAAALVLWVGIAFLATSRLRSRAAAGAVWIIAILIPVFVGVSRIYRGMHHVTDVIASVILGIGALTFALFAMRASDAATRKASPISRSDRPALELREAS